MLNFEKRKLMENTKALLKTEVTWKKVKKNVLGPFRGHTILYLCYRKIDSN